MAHRLGRLMTSSYEPQADLTASATEIAVSWTKRLINLVADFE